MIRIPAIAVLLTGLAAATAGTDPSASDKVPSTRDSGTFAGKWKPCAGRSSCARVPVYKISKQELRAISDRELDKTYPGPKRAVTRNSSPGWTCSRPDRA